MAVPVPLILAAGLLLLRRPTTTSAAARAPAVRLTGPTAQQNYTTPTSTAAKLAAGVVSMLTNGRANPAVPAGAVAATEAARAAVRAGDAYYGAGANAWYVGNTEEARAAVRAGDDYYATAWDQPAAVAAWNTASVTDGIVAAPDDLQLADMAAGIGATVDFSGLW